LAIFLSTFVMIGQNRQAAFRHAKADHDFEAQTNTELTRQSTSSQRNRIGASWTVRPEGTVLLRPARRHYRDER
jgi:uncharacterized membrane protein